MKVFVDDTNINQLATSLSGQAAAEKAKAASYEFGSPDYTYHVGRAEGIEEAARAVSELPWGRR